MSKITAAILVIGNEILSGRTVDKNIAFIAAGLNDLGIFLEECRVVRDDETAIVKALNALRQSYTYVFTTGGIGPTHDDITSQSIAKAFGVKCPKNAEAEKILRDYYGENINDARLKMAEIPVGANLIANTISKAPGFILGNVYCFAGIPSIMQAMFSEIKPTLMKGEPILCQNLSCHIPESVLAPGLDAIQKAYVNVDIGSYPHYEDGKPFVTIALRSTDEPHLQKAYQEISQLVATLESKR